MADAPSRRSARAPDPLGKRALYWAGGAGEVASPPHTSPAPPLPVGKRALYSGALPDEDEGVSVSDDPLAARGAFTVRCQRCRRTSRVGLIDLLIFQFPIGVWVPRGRFDRRMTCPSCRRRAWCSVTLRRH
jgi:hypothetical protein